MATRILQVLAGEVQERKAQRCDPDMPLFRENEMLIFVGMSLGRLLRPFEYFMEVLLDWHKLRGHVDLEGVTTTLVSCRQPNDTTGLTFQVRLARAPPTGKTDQRIRLGNRRVTNHGHTNRPLFAVHATDTGYP